jgi:hypothetical protein
VKWERRYPYTLPRDSERCLTFRQAWKAKCPELLNSTATFQGSSLWDSLPHTKHPINDLSHEVHDFFTPQPIRNPAVFLLRVVLHDWPDDFARKILLQLREAADSETKLLIGDFILPLACPDNVGEDSCLEDIDGAASAMPPIPLLPNLGKASANVFWMDLTVYFPTSSMFALINVGFYRCKSCSTLKNVLYESP